MAMKKDPAAVALGQRRWAGISKSARSAHAKAASAHVSVEGRRKAQAASVVARLAKKSAAEQAATAKRRKASKKR